MAEEKTPTARREFVPRITLALNVIVLADTVEQVMKATGVVKYKAPIMVTEWRATYDDVFLPFPAKAMQMIQCEVNIDKPKQIFLNAPSTGLGGDEKEPGKTSKGKDVPGDGKAF